MPVLVHPTRLWYPAYLKRGFRQVVLTYVRSCFLPLHARHMLCRLWMSWFGGSDGMMWSIVQSLPSSVLLHVAQIGSSIVLAYALAFTHSLLWCHSAMFVSVYECFG